MANRVQHRNLPNWPGAILFSRGVWFDRDDHLHLWVVWDRADSPAVVKAGWFRADVLGKVTEE